MKSLTGPAHIFAFDPFKESATPDHALGTRSETADGRVYRYGWAGEAITLAHLATGPAINSALISMTVIAGAKDATNLTFTNAATTTTAGYFDQGFAAISAGTGIGQLLQIARLEALVSGASSAVTLEDPIQTALDTTSRLDLVQNPYAQVLMTATATLEPVGVPMLTVTTQYYAWFQTRGVAALRTDATIAAGTWFFNDGSVAGEVDVGTEAAGVVNPQAGRAYQLAGAANLTHPVFLTIE